MRSDTDMETTAMSFYCIWTITCVIFLTDLGNATENGRVLTLRNKHNHPRYRRIRRRTTSMSCSAHAGVSLCSVFTRGSVCFPPGRLESLTRSSHSMPVLFFLLYKPVCTFFIGVRAAGIFQNNVIIFTQQHISSVIRPMWRHLLNTCVSTTIPQSSLHWSVSQSCNVFFHISCTEIFNCTIDGLLTFFDGLLGERQVIITVGCTQLKIDVCW